MKTVYTTCTTSKARIHRTTARERERVNTPTTGRTIGFVADRMTSSCDTYSVHKHNFNYTLRKLKVTSVNATFNFI